MGPEESKAVAKSHKTAVIVSALLILTTVLYVLVVEFLKGHSDIHPQMAGETFAAILKYFFLALAVFSTLFAMYIKGLFTGGKAFAQKPVDPAGTAGMLLSSSVVVNALAETSGIYGLIYYILTRDRFFFYVLLFISYIGFYLFFPRRGTWVGIIEKVKER